MLPHQSFARTQKSSPPKRLQYFLNRSNYGVQTARQNKADGLDPTALVMLSDADASVFVATLVQ